MVSPLKSFLPTTIVRFSIPERKHGYPWMELYGALVAALSFLCAGAVQSYTSGAIFSLQNDKISNITVTKSDISWIASTPPLASLFGTLVIGPVVENFGQKRTITLLSFPLIIGWLLIGIAVNVRMILVGRFCTGISIGMARATAPIYVSEAVRAKHRGKLGYLPPIMAALGVLLGYALGSAMQWKQLALLMASFPAVLLLSSLFLPESPYWLIRRNQEDLAFQSLRQLRHKTGVKQDEEEHRIYQEIHEIRDSFGEVAASTSSSGIFSLMKDPSIRIPAMNVFCLMIFQQFSGVSAVIYYLKMILSVGNIPGLNFGLTSDLRPMVVGITHLVSFFISLPLVDRVGRRFLLKVSGALMSLSHLTLAIYFYYYVPSDTSASPLNIMHGPIRSSLSNATIRGANISSTVLNSSPIPDAASLTWLPLTCLCSYVASFSLASPIPFILMSEIFGAHVRSYLCSAATLICSTASFLIVHMFPIFLEIGLPFTFALFAFFSILNTVMGFIIPETKGKTLAQIENLFRAPKGFKGKMKEVVEVDYLEVAMIIPQEVTPTSSKDFGRESKKIWGEPKPVFNTTYGAVGVGSITPPLRKF